MTGENGRERTYGESLARNNICVIIYKEVEKNMKTNYQKPNLEFVQFTWSEIVRTSNAVASVFFDKNYFFDRDSNGFGAGQF